MQPNKKRKGGLIDGEKLRTLRELHPMTMEELANLSGLSWNTVWRLENEERTPHPSTVRKLASVLGIEPKELMRRRV